MCFKMHKINSFPEKKSVPTLPKIFTHVSQNTLLIWPQKLSYLNRPYESTVKYLNKTPRTVLDGHVVVP